jgi:hypothetical protein
MHNWEQTNLLAHVLSVWRGCRSMRSLLMLQREVRVDMGAFPYENAPASPLSAE